MNINELIEIIKAIIHTYIRFMPLGLYFFSYFSTIIFRDLRGLILLFGLILNDTIGLLYKKFYKVQDKAACSTMGNPGQEGSLAPNLPNAHTEYISFILSFFLSKAVDKRDKDPTVLIFLVILVLLTIYSRVATGCKTLEEAMLNLIFGMLWGGIYYFMVSKYYNKAEDDTKERNVCEYGYDNYKCATIKDGTVIVKKPMKDLEKIEKENIQKEVNDTYYD